MSDPIRAISLAESADLAARRAVETQEPQPNPHPAGSTEALQWHSAYCRYLLLHGAPEGVEGGA